MCPLAGISSYHPFPFSCSHPLLYLERYRCILLAEQECRRDITVCLVRERGVKASFGVVYQFRNMVGCCYVVKVIVEFLPWVFGVYFIALFLSAYPRIYFVREEGFTYIECHGNFHVLTED